MKTEDSSEQAENSHPFFRIQEGTWRVHYAEGIWKRRFHSENTSNVFRPRCGARKKKKAPITGHFGSVFLRRLGNVLRPHWNKKPGFQITPFCDGLVWTLGLTVITRHRFQNSTAKCERSLNFSRLLLSISLGLSVNAAFSWNFNCTDK